MGPALIKPLVPRFRIVMLGLDNSGKTTILYRIKQKIFSQHRPTIGFNCETIASHRKLFQIWDVGGQEKTRSLWRSYSRQSDLMMFVVDLEDKERLDEAKLEMMRMVRILGKSVPIMILANKMDLPGTISETTLTKFLGLSDSQAGLWTVRECCAVTGEGLENVLDEASKLIKNATRLKKEKYKRKY